MVSIGWAVATGAGIHAGKVVFTLLSGGSGKLQKYKFLIPSRIGSLIAFAYGDFQVVYPDVFFVHVPGKYFQTCIRRQVWGDDAGKEKLLPLVRTVDKGVCFTCLPEQGFFIPVLYRHHHLGIDGHFPGVYPAGDSEDTSRFISDG